MKNTAGRSIAKNTVEELMPHHELVRDYANLRMFVLEFESELITTGALSAISCDGGTLAAWTRLKNAAYRNWNDPDDPLRGSAISRLT
jgi:hypothetical protein